MALFEDYHRTVVGYHGTGLASALRVVNRLERFKPSTRPIEWLGHGVYFWEYAPERALAWAKLRQKQLRRKKDRTPEEEIRAYEPLAVVGAMIRLGFCIDLLDNENVNFMMKVHSGFVDYIEKSEDKEMPTNDRYLKELDCQVFEFAHLFLKTEMNVEADTLRGVYVPPPKSKKQYPQGEGPRAWPTSWIIRNTEIQLCVRNPSSILGTWLHYPVEMDAEDKDVKKALSRSGILGTRDHAGGVEEIRQNIGREENRSDGPGEGADQEAGRKGKTKPQGVEVSKRTSSKSPRTKGESR